MTVKQALKFRGKDISFLERKRYYGFENNKIRSFLKLSFWNYKSFTSMRWKISKNKFNPIKIFLFK